MAIGFDVLPDSIRTPGVYAELNNRRANKGLLTINARCLLVGQRLAGGTAPANTAVLVRDEVDALTLFGRGSMLHHMVKAFRDADQFTELWAYPLLDNGAGIAPTATLTVTGTPATSGSFSLYIAAYRTDVTVLTTDTPTSIAARLVSAINANPDLPVTAANTAGVVTLTCRHKGLEQNDLAMCVNWFGEPPVPGLNLPYGVPTAFTGGTLNPLVDFSTLAEEIFDFVVFPYTDAGNILGFNAEFGLTNTGRWGPLQQLDGFGISAKKASVAGLQTFGSGLNGPFLSHMGYSGSFTPPWLVAADLAGTVAVPLTNDPARPVTGLALRGFFAPKSGTDRFNQSERNTLLYNGISTFKVGNDGVALIEQLVTNYQKNTQGQIDPSWLKANTPLTLSYYRQSLRAWLLPKFERYKLADDGTAFGAGQNVVTPSIIKVEVLAWAKAQEQLALLENYKTFEQQLIVERDPSNPNRVNILLPTDLVNQLDIIGVVIEFRV
jgi:phage tail sheath gpL-like